MVDISVSFPNVNVFVTDLWGVLDVTMKLFPVCWISMVGLISLAVLMTSSGKAERKERGGQSSILLYNNILNTMGCRDIKQHTLSPFLLFSYNRGRLDCVTFSARAGKSFMFSSCSCLPRTVPIFWSLFLVICCSWICTFFAFGECLVKIWVARIIFL